MAKFRLTTNSACREDDKKRKIGSFPQPVSDNQARLRVYTVRACDADPAVLDSLVTDFDSGSFVIRLVSLDMNAPKRDDWHYNALNETPGS